MAVVFVDDSTCQRTPAKFQVVNDETLEITVPQLSKESHQPVIIVQTPSGVTMTLRKNLRVIESKGRYIHDRFAAGPLPELWMSADSAAGNVEMAIAYVGNRCEFSAAGRGTDTVFAANGSRIALSFLADCVVYHEPFMFTTRMPALRRDAAEANAPGLKFVPVLAIRPSFLDFSFAYSN
jgi:hypothetical protein